MNSGWLQIALLVLAASTAHARAAGTVAVAVALKEGPGQDKVLMHCQTCHSLAYVEMNAHIPAGEKGWNAEIMKMINAYGAPIPKEDIPILLKYLTSHY